ncbi:MAG: hypothetical protein IPF50_15905 [Proteobacteria bacterium]|nr:hypothetical protein [Pseudomonadota bacterium]
MPVRPAGVGQTAGRHGEQETGGGGGGQHERMSAVDTAWLRMAGPASTMMIVSVMTTATPVPAADLRRILETRLLCFPRSQARRGRSLGASWIEDSDFDLDAHFVVTGLPGKGGRHELQGARGEAASQRFDPARPLWQLHSSSTTGTGSAWVRFAPLLRGRHRDDPGAAVIDRTGCRPRACRSARGGIARRTAQTTQRRCGPVATARLDQPADPTRGRHRRKRPGRRRDCSRRACTSCFTRRPPPRSRSRPGAWSANSRASSHCPTTPCRPCGHP